VDGRSLMRFNRVNEHEVNLPQTVRIREIREETRTIRSFVLDVELEGSVPGQFIMLWLPGVDEKPMSIAWPAPLTVTVARVGPFSAALHQRKEGDRVGWRGPYGRGFSLLPERPAVLIGGGCGVTPLYFLAARAVEQNISTIVALGAHTALDLPYVERFRALHGVELVLTTDDGSLGRRGFRHHRGQRVARSGAASASDLRLWSGANAGSPLQGLPGTEHPRSVQPGTVYEMRLRRLWPVCAGRFARLPGWAGVRRGTIGRAS
jgi:NAD(P)H-flavin reductase